MRLPTYLVEHGVVNPISTHKDTINLVGAGYGQAVPDVTLLGKEAVGYMGDCMFRTDDPDLDFCGKSWTLQFYGRIIGSAYMFSNFESNGAPHGWYYVMSAGNIDGYITVPYGVNSMRTYRTQIIKFPKHLRTDEAKHYAFVKELDKLSIYINYELAATLKFSTVKSRAFGIFGLIGAKEEAYSYASSVYCNYLRIDYDFIAPVSEFQRFDSKELPIDEQMSFFNPLTAKSADFDFPHLLEIKDFTPPLLPSDYAKATPIIPTLTADVSNGYTVAASSLYSGTYPAWKAFPGSTYVPSPSNCWVSNTAGGPHWLSISRNDNVPYEINAFRITTPNNSGYYPVDFILQGKNAEDTEWNDIHEVKGAVLGASWTTLYTGFATATYSQYRIYCTKWDPTKTYMAIAELQFYLAAPVPGSKTFNLSNGEKEVIRAEESGVPGILPVSISMSTTAYPRTLSMTLDNNQVIELGTQASKVTGAQYPWGQGAGYLKKTGATYVTKELRFNNCIVEEKADSVEISYLVPALYPLTSEQQDIVHHLLSPGDAPFAIGGASVWIDLPLSLLRLNEMTPNANKLFNLPKGRYYLHGNFLLGGSAYRTLQLVDENDLVLCQSLASFCGNGIKHNGQVEMRGILDIKRDSIVRFRAAVSTVTNNTGTTQPNAVITKTLGGKFTISRI